MQFFAFNLVGPDQINQILVTWLNHLIDLVRKLRTILLWFFFYDRFKSDNCGLIKIVYHQPNNQTGLG